MLLHKDRKECDRLVFEDILILENLYSTFEQKITLKNDAKKLLRIGDRNIINLTDALL